ncbi:unnamed protein product [Dovyalis caffra]|uniref:Uncharacterized protein n=1 Tax=Dovyalis caffra TaxID=77055 RepID=A0AAV1SSB9_9ROSI|nr:unnamed protein product [Dovyalis caffra]
MSESPIINDGVDSLAMLSRIPKNFEKENEVAKEPVKQEVVDGEISNIWNTTYDHAKHYEIQKADKNTENLVPFTNSTNSVEENCKVKYQSRVSSVEFLGEFEVGEMRSPLRSCASFLRYLRLGFPLPLYGRFTNEKKIAKKQVKKGK